MPALTEEQRPNFADQNVFRDAISRFATGVTVITTRADGHDFGTTASAISSLSMDPPMLLICLNRTSSTQAAIRQAGFFAVNVLADEQADLASAFATKSGDKFAGVDIVREQTTSPLISKALAYFECRVTELATGGTHTVFLAEVQNAVAREGSPLTYFRGKFGRFENALQEQTYTKLRELILTRELPLSIELEVDALMSRLDADRAQVYYALTKLTGEGLVQRDSDDAYRITPLSAQNARQALDARGAVELSIVEHVINTASDEQLARLLRSAERAARSGTGGAPTLDAFVASAREYHEAFVALSDNAYLIDFHRRIGVHGIWLRALDGTEWEPTIDGARFTDVAAALADRDADRAKARIQQVIDRLKAMATAAIEGAGGSL
jgi:flavin reductase (DIM6/NTAB) family NADH-FMN oxidoreductase RutF